MNEQLELLKKLQEIDSTILSMADEVDQLSKKAGKDSMLLKQAQASFNTIKAGHDTIVKKRKEKEQELQDIQDQIEKSKAKSSELKTNKEYEAHLREIGALKEKTDRVEEETLAIMESVDASAKEMQEEEAKVRKAEEEWKKDEELLENEKKKMHDDIESFKSKRNEFIERIDDEHYDFYMDLLKKLGGSAVVMADNEICLGCNTNIPPQLYNEVKANDRIIHCYYCHRFLYRKEK